MEVVDSEQSKEEDGGVEGIGYPPEAEGVPGEPQHKPHDCTEVGQDVEPIPNSSPPRVNFAPKSCGLLDYKLKKIR